MKAAVKANDVHLENEEEFKSLFGDCEVGAMPPFGNLYGIPVLVDETVFEDDEITFNGGNHASLVKMEFAEYQRLVNPRKVSVGERRT